MSSETVDMDRLLLPCAAAHMGRRAHCWLTLVEGTHFSRGYRLQTMAHLQRAVASLRIAGDDLVPDEVSKLLGATPSLARTKGQRISLNFGRSRTARFGQWHLQASDTEPEDLDGQVAELLDQLTGDLRVWSDLARRFQVDLFCGWFLGESNEGVVISSATLKALGERGIELGLDIYGPGTED